MRPFVGNLGEDSFVGVAVSSTALAGHVGLVYRSSEGAERILHLAWHHDLRDELLAPNRHYLVCSSGLDEIESTVLAAILENVSSVVGFVPYGVDWETADNCFDSENRLISLPLGKGLTCATFVYAILRHHGYVVADRATWTPNPSDDEFVHRIADWLAANAGREHAEALRADVGKNRLRPFQVAACVASSPDEWPVAFGVAVERSASVQSAIDKALAEELISAL